MLLVASGELALGYNPVEYGNNRPLSMCFWFVLGYLLDDGGPRLRKDETSLSGARLGYL